MSGQNGHDEAARLELALARIARAAQRPPQAPRLEPMALHGPAGHVTTPGLEPGHGPGRGLDTAEIAARLDELIAEIRTLLGPQEF